MPNVSGTVCVHVWRACERSWRGRGRRRGCPQLARCRFIVHWFDGGVVCVRHAGPVSLACAVFVRAATPVVTRCRVVAQHCLCGAARLRSRCRLYRVADGEWKQRGTGDIKILKHRTAGTFRVVMRQEKTLKVVANHRLDPAVALVRVLHTRARSRDVSTRAPTRACRCHPWTPMVAR